MFGRKREGKRGSFLGRLLLSLTLILVVVGGIGYATGVIRFYATDEKAGVEVDKQQIESSTEQAREKVGDAVESAGEAIKQD